MRVLFFFLSHLLWCCVFEYLSSKPLGIASTFSVSKLSRSVVSDYLWPHGLQPARLLCPWSFPGKNTGVGYYLLHGNLSRAGIEPIFPVSPALAGDSLPLHHLGSPSKLQTNKTPRRQRAMHILEKQTRKMSHVPKEIEPQRHPVCACSVTRSCPTLWDSTDGNPPDSSVPRIYTWWEY